MGTWWCLSWMMVVVVEEGRGCVDVFLIWMGCLGVEWRRKTKRKWMNKYQPTFCVGTRSSQPLVNVKWNGWLNQKAKVDSKSSDRFRSSTSIQSTQQSVRHLSSHASISKVAVVVQVSNHYVYLHNFLFFWTNFSIKCCSVEMFAFSLLSFL